MPGSSVHGIFQAGTLEQVAISFSRGSSWRRDPNYMSCASWIGRWILYYCATCCCSVTESWLTLQTHERQHARLPCSSLSPRVCSNSCPLSQWCYPSISSFVTSFSSCLQSLNSSRVFSMSQFFVSGSQSIGASASAAVFPVNIQGWFSLGLTGLISFRIDWFDLLAVQWNLKSLLQHHNSKHQFFSTEPSLWSNSHICTWLLEKTHSFDYMDLCQQSDVSAF